MMPADRAEIQKSMEHWAKRMPTVKLYDGMEASRLFLETYPGNEQSILQHEVLQAEIDAREDAYIAWLESQGMPNV